MPTSFIAVYRGETISGARLIAISADPALVNQVTSQILETYPEASEDDPVVECVESGRRRALHLIKGEALHDAK